MTGSKRGECCPTKCRTLVRYRRLRITDPVYLHRELNGATTIRHEWERTAGRPTGVHELAGLLLWAWLLDLSRYLDLSRHLDRAGLLYLSLRFGLGETLPGYPQRERTGHQCQKYQSGKDHLRNRTSMPPNTAPLCTNRRRIIQERATAKLLPWHLRRPSQPAASAIYRPPRETRL
jgi:hypothetical protein